MNFSIYTRQDWLLIRSAIVWLGSAMLLAGVLLLGTQIYLYFSEQEQRSLREQLQQVRSRADAAQMSWQSVREHHAQFNLLQKRSIFGEERRLDWIEALANKAKMQPDMQLQYQFSPQKALPQSAPLHDLQIYASMMRINFLARNELGFSDFTQWLATLPGYAAPTSCLLRRAESAGLVINCEYAWLTISPVKAEVAP
ncbi:hypothetical protein [Deefgea rivuli]|uniref:hypothetical protein n=1 Tax=Deefgea rivuli TaxID=400948 RepID=UPI00047FBEF6|nr:hypothetical protein [Deefgea rivuli]